MAVDIASQGAVFNRFKPLANTLVAKLKRVPKNVWRNGIYILATWWICHSVAGLFWAVTGTPVLEQPTNVAVADVRSQDGPTQAVNLTELQSLKLFGDGSAPPPVVDTEPEQKDIGDDAKTTRLNLKLQGTMVNNINEKSGAIIEAGSDQAYYKVGDEIEKNRGVKLVKVMEQKVILDNKGSIEALWLYSEDDFKKNKRDSRKKVSKKANTKPKVKPENTIVAKAKPNQIPKSIGDVVRFSVHREEGKMVGYRIRPGKDKALFEQLGLKPNDIVTNVNGIDVDDPAKIRSVYKEVKKAPEAQLTILRDGQTFSVNISVDGG